MPDNTFTPTASNQIGTVPSQRELSSFTTGVEINPKKILLRASNPLINGITMDEANTIQLFERAESRLTTVDLGQSLIDRPEEGQPYTGEDGLLFALLADASEEITERVATGESEVDAFNEITSSWPHELQAWLAAFEADQHDAATRDEEYLGHAENFAESVGVSISDMSSEPIETEFSMNPFTDDSITTAEARLVALLRLLDNVDNGDIPDIIADVHHVNRFRDWLEAVDDVEDAIRAHEFPYREEFKDIIPACAPPDEWPDNMDPAAPISRRCDFCGEMFYHVFHESVGEAWVSEHGTPREIWDTTDDDDPIYVADDLGAAVSLCIDCRDSTFHANSTEVATITGNGVAKIYTDRSTIEDVGEHDDAFDPAGPLRESMNAASRGSGPMGQHYIEIDEFPEAAADTSAQVEAMEAILNGMVPSELPGGEVYVVRTQNGSVSMITHRDASVARRAKEFLNNADNYANV